MTLQVADKGQSHPTWEKQVPILLVLGNVEKGGWVNNRHGIGVKHDYLQGTASYYIG
jgi:hypothetical protein